MNPERERNKLKMGFSSIFVVAMTCLILVSIGAPSMKNEVFTQDYSDAIFLSAIDVHGERYGVFKHEDTLAFVNSKSQTTWQDRTSKLLWLADECFIPELDTTERRIDLVKCKTLPLAAEASADRVVMKGGCYNLTSDSSTGEMHFLQCA
jgi:hypothetical protein